LLCCGGEYRIPGMSVVYCHSTIQWQQALDFRKSIGKHKSGVFFRGGSDGSTINWTGFFLVGTRSSVALVVVVVRRFL